MHCGLLAPTCTEVVTYHTGGVGVKVADPGVMDAMREARVDVISFFSASAVENLRGELGASVAFTLLGEQRGARCGGPSDGCGFARKAWDCR